MIPGMVLTLTSDGRAPASAEATMLIKPALGSASATQPTTRMKGGTSIGSSASTPTKPAAGHVGAGGEERQADAEQHRQRRRAGGVDRPC